MNLDRSVFTDALVAMVAEGTGKKVGKEGPPKVAKQIGGRTELVDLNVSDISAFPYYVCWPLTGTRYTGPPYGDEPFADAHWLYQFDVVALRGDQRDKANKRIRDVVLGRAEGKWIYELRPDGMGVMTRGFAGDAPETGEGGIVASAVRFEFQVTPR
jgi:hypothetical protein